MIRRTKLRFDELNILLEIHLERRASARVSLGKDKAILRIPFLSSIPDTEKHIEWAKNWIGDRIKSDASLKERYSAKAYVSGKKYMVLGEEIVLQVVEKGTDQVAKANLVENTLQIYLPEGLEDDQKKEVCSTVIHGLISRRFLPRLKMRVFELNHKHYQRTYRNVKIRHNHSNWGSCSTAGNLSFSSRLLLTPLFVYDYVIIHELAHLVEHNHSDRFWAQVARAMPDFQRAEDWLRIHGEKCFW
ncbi:MAG: M48 family metallopeptidase [Saprospiraceae bacterium]|nr:M48 family metallopeptidase [Saprospiraceae bacterium]